MFKIERPKAWNQTRRARRKSRFTTINNSIQFNSIQKQLQRARIATKFTAHLHATASESSHFRSQIADARPQFAQSMAIQSRQSQRLCSPAPLAAEARVTTMKTMTIAFETNSSSSLRDCSMNSPASDVGKSIPRDLGKRVQSCISANAARLPDVRASNDNTNRRHTTTQSMP